MTGRATDPVSGTGSDTASGADPDRASAAGRDGAPAAAGWPWSLRVPTRWGDEDRYGHVNNALAYPVFENAIMGYLQSADLDPNAGEVRCYTVENGCTYLAPVHHPDTLVAGLGVSRLGRTSVRYEIAVSSGRDARPRWRGFVVDVFVDAATERPVPVPAPYREALAPLLLDSAPPSPAHRR